MNRKDLMSLMEAYEDVALDKELGGDDDLSPENDLEMSDGDKFSLDNTPELGEGSSDEPSHEEMENEKERMVKAHLHTIRSHAHEIFSVVENGALIEPWMEEKIAIANDYIVHVANAIMYRK